MKKEFDSKIHNYRIREMGRVLSCIFLNISNDQMNNGLREMVKEELKMGSPSIHGEVTMSDLAEFMFQVGGYMFHDENND